MVEEGMGGFLNEEEEVGMRELELISVEPVTEFSLSSKYRDLLDGGFHIGFMHSLHAHAGHGHSEAER